MVVGSKVVARCCECWDLPIGAVFVVVTSKRGLVGRNTLEGTLIFRLCHSILLLIDEALPNDFDCYR